MPLKLRNRSSAPSRALGRTVGPVLWLWVLLPALAHGHGVRTDVSVSLDQVRQPQLSVELHQGHIAPQLVLAHHGAGTLVLLDTAGQPMLRFEGQEVWLNLNSADARRSLNPGASGPAPAAKPDMPVRWQALEVAGSYGWFDPRIHPEVAEVSQEHEVFAQRVPIQSWTIPILLNGAESAISGQFIYEPPPRGRVQTILRTRTEPVPGLRLQLVSSARPALFIDNRSAQPARVLDADGAHLIEIGPDGVAVDTDHPLWALARQPGQPIGESWQKLGTAPRFAWLEPRTIWSGPVPSDADNGQVLGHFSVPLQWGEQQFSLQGSHIWLSAPP